MIAIGRKVERIKVSFTNMKFLKTYSGSKFRFELSAGDDIGLPTLFAACLSVHLLRFIDFLPHTLRTT